MPLPQTGTLSGSAAWPVAVTPLPSQVKGLSPGGHGDASASLQLSHECGRERDGVLQGGAPGLSLICSPLITGKGAASI